MQMRDRPADQPTDTMGYRDGQNWPKTCSKDHNLPNPMLSCVKNAQERKKIYVQPTDRPTDQPTDRVTYRVACTRLTTESRLVKV